MIKQGDARLAVERKNAWGNYAKRDEQDYQVEASDVGKTHPNYLGMGHKSYTFKASDVGRTITILSSPGWSCWSFAGE